MKAQTIWRDIILLLLVIQPAVDACRRRRGPPPDRTKPYKKKCPADKHVIADPQARGTRVRWDRKLDVVFADSHSGFHSKWLGAGSGQPGDYFTEEGSPHVISYSARDNAGNVFERGCVFRIFVTVVRCPYFSPPSHGYISCSHGNIYGSDCNVNCLPGFELEGAQTSRCQQNGQWSGDQPVCSAVTCPALTDIVHGEVTCTNSNFYQSSCIYQCADGYSIGRGQLNSRICGATESWSGSVPSCEDTSRPALQCPVSIVAYADEGETSTQVFWDVPTVEDNSGEGISVDQVAGPDPGAFLEAGYYTVRYIATDSSGNEAQCQFSLLVRVIQCPGIFGSHTQLVDCPTGYNFGSICTIQCAAGYVISGETTLKCGRHGDPPRGRWSAERPVCNAVQCPVLEAPENGRFRNDASSCPNNYAAWCYFECDEGFQRIGSYSRHCLAHSGELEGYWDGEETVCEPATCPSPYIPAHAHIANEGDCPTVGNVPAGTECQYACDEGHILVGPEAITCDNNGRWSASFPRCEIITCDSAAVPVPQNGYKNRCPFQKISFGSTCFLGCNQGFMPTVGSEVTCLANDNGSGRWEGTFLTVCDPVKCVPFDPPEHGFIQGCSHEGMGTDTTESQVFPSVCTAACDDGYTPFGSVNRNCLISGIWDGLPLDCLDVTAPSIVCPDPITEFAQPRNNFVVSDFSWEPLQVVDVSPPVDVRLLSINSVGEGENRTTVFTEGLYSFLYLAVDQEGNEDTCTVDLTVRVTRCPPLGTPQNGESELIIGEGTCAGYAVLGSVCRFTCEEGYHLSGGAEEIRIECAALTATSTLGYWNGEPEECEPNTCNVPAVTNGYISGCFMTRVDYQTTCQFICNVGFKSATGVSQIRRTCKADGAWTGTDLLCQAVTCSGNFQLENGLISPSSCTTEGNLPYGSICQFTCDDGFRQTGPYSKRCGEDGTWSNPRNVVCIDEQAPRFTDSCPIYYQAYAESGSTEAVVNYDIPEATDNAGLNGITIEKQSGLDSGDRFQEGSHIITYTGEDEAGNQARCDIHVTVLVHRCNSLQAPASGSLRCPRQNAGATCDFQCNQGYELDGPASLTCILQASRPTWDGSPPLCTPVQCPAIASRPPAIKSGCQLATESYGAVCLWACPYGYQGSGSPVSTCQADGSWSADDFECSEKQCPSLVLPDFIRERPANCNSDPSFEDSCHLSCKETGYRIDPPTLDFIRCRGDGQWSQDISDLSCIDYQAPRFTSCPLDFPVYADRGLTQAFVNWEVTATDNSGEDIVPQCDREFMTFPIGDYFTSCSARDSTGNIAICQFWFRVRTRNCQQLNPPVFGLFIGPCHTNHGSVCTITCIDGYQLQGPDRASCERNEQTEAMYWERDAHPVCRISSCPSIPMGIIPPGGGIYPTFCTGKSNPHYGVSCRFYCRNGYTLVGHQDPISCQSDGTWDVDLSSVPFICEDRVNPIVEVCPGNQYANLNEGSTDVEVFFDTPSCRDNSGEPLRLQKTPRDITSPYRFTETTFIRYEFFDAANNSASCSFQIFVQNNLFPEIDFCPDDIIIEATGRLTSVTWDPPIFSEPSGDNDALLVSCTFESGTQLPWGSHNIVCSARNRNNGKTVECRFSVEVVPRSCPPLRVPRNGALACDEWAYGHYCNQQCNDQFDVPPGRYEPFFICGASGLWSSSRVLDCSFRRRASKFNLATEIQYFSGDCNDPAVQQEIREAFIELIGTQSLNEDVCEGWQECRAENVKVECGETRSRRGDLAGTRRRRRFVVEKEPFERDISKMNYADYLFLREAEEYTRQMQKRNVVFEMYEERVSKRNARRASREKTRKKRSLGFLITIAFEIVADLPEELPAEQYEETAYDTLYTLYDVVDVLEQEAVEGNLVPEVPDLELEVEEDSFVYDYPAPSCDLGSVVSWETLTCVPCAPGSYYDTIELDCILCPIAEYQDSEAQTECKICPAGTTTLEEGAQDVSECLTLCLPGQFSFNGVEPCALCEIGFYQPNEGSDSCIVCPQSRSTLERGSVSSLQCLFECAQGHWSETGLEPCQPCSIRYYQPDFGQRSCNLCPGITTTVRPGAIYEEHCNVTATCEENNCENGATCLPLIEGQECQCPEGFEGEYCEINIDDCTDLSCDNGGTCVDGPNSFTCLCTSGFEGDDCSVDIDECSSQPCVHSSMCVDTPGDFICDCLDGYTGKVCDQEILPCLEEPCQNGGTCHSNLGAFNCTCPPGYLGEFCEVDIDECQRRPCWNGGSCLDLPNGFECFCTPGYGGLTCEVDLDLCNPNPCVHGECAQEGDNFTCICNSGKAGHLCQRDATPCDSEPCKHGVCSNNPQTIEEEVFPFTCDCTNTGYSGINCDIFVDHCQGQPCSNHATCVNSPVGYTCLCQPSFTGQNCEQYINPCDEAPCMNNGSCTPDGSTFRCVCTIGFEGERCDQPWITCREGFCQNGGHCGPLAGTDFCVCLPGFKGVACEKDINECKSEPCENGGTCTDGVNQYTCDCPPGYSGGNCEVNVDDCWPEPCINGICIDKVNGYSCNCFEGFEGLNCDVNTDDCIGNECIHGNCQDRNGTYTCQCQSGYRGRFCEEEVNECTSDPCVHAVECTDQVNAYQCVCEDGWTGTQCELSVNDCVPEACLNGGTCRDQHQGYSCICLPGFTGERCEGDINECSSDPCVNGTCIDVVDGYRCTCPRGRAGKQCQVQTSICQPNPCSNGGTCSLDENIDSYSCFCINGFVGNHCEVNVDDCVGHECVNGARCVDEVNGYSCLCTPGYDGDTCEEIVDLCLVFPCQNGGTCSVTEGQVECACLEGYEGALCEKNVDDCFPDPCLHGGICQDGLNEFTCECAPGYRGEVCDEEIDECLDNKCDLVGTMLCEDGVGQYTCICRHGFSGPLCETIAKSNFDMIFTANQTAQYVLLRDFSEERTESFTLAFWIRTTSPDSIIFSHVSEEEYSLTSARLLLGIPASLAIIINGIPILSGVSINDDIWHHVALTFDRETSLAQIYVDGIEVKSQVTEVWEDVIIPSELFILGRLNEAEQLTDLSPLSGSLSRLNIWDEVMTSEQIANLSSACYVPVPGNVIGMVDFLDGKVGDVIFEDPSSCDAVDNCEGSPCSNGGFCLDQYHSFRCYCLKGFYGPTCQENPDDCQDNLCENGATCQDGLATYDCVCPEGFTGTLCELEIVDGGWSEWTTWSNCSQACDGGTQTRTRECNNPSPENGGLPCGTNDIETRVCNTEPCPACRPFKDPRRGYSRCVQTETGDMTCSIFCPPGYDFGRPPLYEYICGPGTNYLWNHESTNNPHLRVPACTKYSKPSRFQLEVIARYPFLECSVLSGQEAAAVNNRISLAATSTTQHLGCIFSGICNLASVATAGCVTNIIQESTGRRKRAVEGVTVRMTFIQDVNVTDENVVHSNDIAEQPSAAFAIESLMGLSDDIITSTASGGYSISTNGQVHNPVYEEDFGLIKCGAGSIPVFNTTECLICEAGTYEHAKSCHQCDFGFYQPEEGKTFCEVCPEGRKNTGLGAIAEEECLPNLETVITSN